MLQRSRTYIARRKPVELIATPVLQEQTVETWEGPRTAYPGDRIMRGVKDEQWPVPGALFPELYETIEVLADGRLRVRKKIFELPVYQTYVAMDFEVRGENFHADAGYFIVYHQDKSMYPCDPVIFYRTFEVLRPFDAERDDACGMG